MKIAFVHTFPTHYTVDLFKALSNEHDILFLFHSKGEEKYWLPEHGIRTGAFRHFFLNCWKFGRLKFPPALFQHLWSEKHDIYLATLGQPLILLATLLTAFLRRKPFVLWTGLWHRLGTPFHRLTWPLTLILYKASDAIVVYGPHVKAYLISEGVAGDKIFVERHAVDNPTYGRSVLREELIDIRKRLDLPEEAKVVLYLGRLVASKGVDILIKAFETLDADEAYLVIAGTGDGEDAIKSLAGTSVATKRIRFTGYIAQEDTVPFYALANMVVMPSLTTPEFKEPWGLVANEAFNQGTPVIASQSVGAAAGGLIRDGETGIVVGEGDVTALSRAIQSLLVNRELHSSISIKAKALIDQWGCEQQVDDFLRVFKSVKRNKIDE